ncbi:hypothetical protein ACI3LY_001625 [Candidozyma auris]|uniref:AAA+ ATPase domain-containing protein n=2 Tax=Candidozyma auris TaxID=498019 RepID=A0A2H0ZY84_CANAR|nr:hypothetical protein B9J08_001704 [[Candida] auris]QWW22750.1 hypothetical protein CA7LBN_001497 [[Candida] auris]
MATYTCQTCQAVGSEDIGKHLSTTRHKLVKYNPLDEVIKCEDCEDSNIHLLNMIRYGLSDISLLCNDCKSKQSSGEISATYSLSNGSLFVKLPQYFKFRDIHCGICESQSDLHVANDGSTQYIYCKKCIDDKIPSIKRNLSFVSEDSDSFLFALLGIKEYVPKPGAKAKKLARKVKGKGGKRQRKPKPDAEERKAHYESKMATKARFQQAKTVKAVGSSSTPSPTLSRSATPRSSTPNNPKRDTKKTTASKPKGAKPSRTPTPQPEMKEKSDPKEHIAKKAQSVSKPKKESNGMPSKSSTVKAEQKIDRKTSKSASSKVNGGSKKTNDKKVPPQTPEAPPAKSKKQEDEKQTSPGHSKGQMSATTTSLKLPPNIYEIKPAPEPPMSYPDLKSYFNEMCINLLLEEKAQLNAERIPMLGPDEFVLEWYQENDLKHKQYKAQVLLTPEILDRYLTKNMQAVKQTPFSQDQGLILLLDDRIPWYGRIAMVDTFSSQKPQKKGYKGKGKSRPPSSNHPQICEMAVELFSWNTMPLPTTVDIKHLKLLPVSVPVSRIFTAMSNLRNPSFIDLVLGNKEVKQINFKNYLQLTRDTFNESQKIGLQSVLNNAITVLQGPPGTGKTSTIHEIILQLLEKMNVSPILVVAASNIAIDNIAEKLLPKYGKSILRITSLQKESEYNRDHPLASICLHHMTFDGLPLHLQEALKDLRRPGVKVSKKQYQSLMSALITQSSKLIASKKVILTTTVAAGSMQLKALPKVPVVIMDEATQSSEPTSLIPLSMNGVDKFVFVGDHKQLSSFSEVPNLSLSLFERILRNGTYKIPHMLDTQYRMHPAISEFPRQKFYNNLLKDGITAEDRKMKGIPINPVVFWDTKGKNPESPVHTRFGVTYANRGEVNYIEQVLMTLVFEKGIKKSDIGIITPYRGQRDLISSTLVKNDVINPDKDIVHEDVDRDDYYSNSKPLTVHIVSDIMVASIDAFQGREKKFMIMSCVRSNDANKVGFLKDERRLNVALTRAQYGLILVGDADCLKHDPLWREYIEDLAVKGSLLVGDSFVYS